MATMLEVPPRRRVDKGMCSTCENARDCTHARGAGIPILECDDAPPLEIAYVSPVGVAQGTRAPIPMRSAGKGLCATCDRRHDCTYPKPEGGVWRCEEFE